MNIAYAHKMIGDSTVLLHLFFALNAIRKCLDVDDISKLIEEDPILPVFSDERPPVEGDDVVSWDSTHIIIGSMDRGYSCVPISARLVTRSGGSMNKKDGTIPSVEISEKAEKAA